MVIVCHCHGVSDRVIRAAHDLGGARDVDQVGRVCGAGTDCGGCVPVIRELLERVGGCVAPSVGGCVAPSVTSAA